MYAYLEIIVIAAVGAIALFVLVRRALRVVDRGRRVTSGGGCSCGGGSKCGGGRDLKPIVPVINVKKSPPE